MASSPELVQFVLEQLQEAGAVSAKKMFGEYGLYCDGKYFAVICDNRLLLKVTKGGMALLPAGKMESPYQGAKPMLLVEDLEDADFLCRLTLATCAELPPPKPKKKPEQKSE